MQQDTQLTGKDGRATAVLPPPSVSWRNLAGTSLGFMRFYSSFRGDRPLPVNEPSRNQVSVKLIHTNSQSGQHTRTYLSRAGAEMDQKDESPQAEFSVPPIIGATDKIPSYTTAVLHNESSFSRRYPSVSTSDDYSVEPVAIERRKRSYNRKGFEGLLSKVPHAVWHPNVVARKHRRKANLYWGLLLAGYTVYVYLAISDCFERRKSPPVKLKRINERFQLPDVSFCFESDTYGSRFGCFDGDADGTACASSLRGDAVVYGYNRTGYTTPDGYGESNEHVVLLPEVFSDTCTTFPLSTLSAKESEEDREWRFHMLMFWNSSYKPTTNTGAFESLKMYLYAEGLSAEEVVKTPITLYPPISFDPTEVPFVRGFLEYEQQTFLMGDTKHTYKVVDTTVAPWHNAEEAIDRAALYGTDTLASIQLDVRTQSFNQYSEVEPHDIVGTLGEITGFWLIVPLLFGLLFYRPQNREDDQAKMRKFSICRRQTTTAVAPAEAP